MTGGILSHLVGRPIDRQSKGQQTPDTTAARKIAAPVERNRRQPRPQGAGLVKAPKRTMGCDKDVLNRIQSILGVAQARERETVENVSVPPHNLAKSPVSTGYAERDELAVRKLFKFKAHDYLR